MYPLEGAEEAYQHYPRNRILDKQHQGGSRGRERVEDMKTQSGENVTLNSNATRTNRSLTNIQDLSTV